MTGSDGHAVVGIDNPDTAPMRRLERACSIVLGVGLAGPGLYAVFETSNQAGSATLVIAGTVLLLIGVQGTRLIRLGGGGTNVELAQSRAAARVVKVAQEEENDEKAAGLMEAAATLDPTIFASPRAKANVYQDLVSVALTRVATHVEQQVNMEPFRRIDYLVELGEGRQALVERMFKHYHTLQMTDIEHLVDLARHGGCRIGLLVVTNAALSGDVQELNRQPESEKGLIEVISWNGPRDDGILTRALTRVARTLL